jgi:hypothetical protein
MPLLRFLLVCIVMDVVEDLIVGVVVIAGVDLGMKVVPTNQGCIVMMPLPVQM